MTACDRCGTVLTHGETQYNVGWERADGQGFWNKSSAPFDICNECFIPLSEILKRAVEEWKSQVESRTIVVSGCHKKALDMFSLLEKEIKDIVMRNNEIVVTENYGLMPLDSWWKDVSSKLRTIMDRDES